MYQKAGKRLFDVIVSIFGILMFLPIGLVIAVIVWFDSNGPILFFQHRLGLNGKIYKIYKFRTMYNSTRISTQQIFPDHPEVTHAGKYLRRFKADEIPQLINVIKGEMSIIGPRPCLPELRQKFDENGVFRLKVKPGLFGLADIRGGYYLSWPQRWIYDREYIENLSLILDLKLMFMAIPIIIFDENFYLKRKNQFNKR